MHGIKGVSMTNTSTLTLDGVSFQLPDGSLLFSDLDETFDTRHTGLVGRNGVGKSLLARLLAGHLQPSSGSVRRQGRVRYLAQQLEPADYPTVADLAGVRPWLEALARIEAGSLDAADYECLGERWDIRQRLADALAAEGLGHLRADTPSERLSGGECMRVALLGAFLDDADFLILDEPSNPLDGPARALLRARLAAWDGGLLLVSHDRELLEGMQRIVELSTLGLRSYGGGYSFYAQSREEARKAAERRLDQRRLERKRQTLAMREQQQRQERRQASGRREGKTANQAKILLGGFRERSEVSAGKLRNAHQAERERLDREVREAAREVEEASPLLLDSPDAELAAQRRIVELKGAVLRAVARNRPAPERSATAGTGRPERQRQVDPAAAAGRATGAAGGDLRGDGGRRLSRPAAERAGPRARRAGAVAGGQSQSRRKLAAHAPGATRLAG